MNAKGRIAEDLAVRFLEHLKFKIIARNFRAYGGEIDVIAWDKENLCFIEVKSRQSSFFGYPYEAVNRKKQFRIIRAAQAYLQRNHPHAVPPCRFDIVSISANNPPELLRNAFSLTGR
jgi:putative endonuclease